MKTKKFWCLSLLGTLGVATAQPVLAQGAKKPRLAKIANDTLKLGVGERVTLEFPNVTRIITDDDEVARAFFQGGNAILEGASTGSTTIEVYQASGTPKVLTVQVENTLAATPEISGAPTTDPAPAEQSSVTAIEPLPETPSGSITPSRSGLDVSVSVAPARGNASQADFTITYGNLGPNAAKNVIIRFPLDEQVSLVTGSASDGARYDAALREVSWNIGELPAGQMGQKLTLRVAPIENRPTSFEGVATIEDGVGTSVASQPAPYSTTTTPLLTVFALPDRFLAGKTGPVLVDVKGIEPQSAVDRLQNLGVVSGRARGLFYPAASTQRAEYAVMTLNGLNLRDLRDITQIKFVLGRRSTVNLTIQNSAGRSIVGLIRNQTFDPGEHTAIWNGRVGTAFAAPGRYTYVCTATGKDARGESTTTTLKGTLNIVPQTPLNPTGVPSFIDVKPSDWFSRYLASGEKQGLLFGFPDKTFRPRTPISRIEATAIVVRALGLEDLAKEWNDKEVGFLDYQNIPQWGKKYVNVATVVAKTNSGKSVMRGKPNNFFEPEKELRRDEAALIVQRLIDRETTRRITVSGAMVPGATVTINSRAVEANAQGQFAFSFDSNTSVPTTVAVIDARDR
jgi:uncharacterized repeat protein (TIGR01451 family)